MSLTTIDYRAARPATKGDAGQLATLAAQLVGRRVLTAGIAYPNELSIDFGTEIEFPVPGGRTLVRGSYVLGAQGSAWAVRSAPLGRTVVENTGLPPDRRHLAGKPIPDAEGEEFLSKIGGTTVAAVLIFPGADGYELLITLADGSSIALTPTPDNYEITADEEFPIPPPDWELFTPYDRVLRVGPGFKWAYLPSNEPGMTA